MQAIFHRSGGTYGRSADSARVAGAGHPGESAPRRTSHAGGGPAGAAGARVSPQGRDASAGSADIPTMSAGSARRPRTRCREGDQVLPGRVACWDAPRCRRYRDAFSPRGRRRPRWRLTRAVIDAALRRRRPPAASSSTERQRILGRASPPAVARSGAASTTRGDSPGENLKESFFHSLKADVIHGRLFATAAALRHELRR